MAYSAVNLLKNITNDSSVAKNHHLHVVPEIKNKIQEALRVAKQIESKNVNGELSENVEMFNDEAAMLTKALDAFLAKWPYPKVDVIVDEVEIKDLDPERVAKAVFSQSRPLVPLTLRSGGKQSGILLYEDVVTGDLYSVPNMLYNKPNTVEVKTWSY
jgi:hypothetical protein